jgi:SH3-like domain-containing protein
MALASSKAFAARDQAAKTHFTMRRIILTLVLMAFAVPALAATRYVSLRSDKAFLREGPTYQHRVLFVYKRKDYPLQVLSVYESWRHVRDADGTTGWMSQTMLSDARTALVVGHGLAMLRSAPFAAAPVVAKAQPGVVAKLRACKPQFCEIVAGSEKGWIDRTRIWGVDAGELIN